MGYGYGVMVMGTDGHSHGHEDGDDDGSDYRNGEDPGSPQIPSSVRNFTSVFEYTIYIQ